MIGEKFKVEFLKTVFDFLDQFNEKARDKILFNIDKSDKKVTIVVATHGIIKKTRKTPKKEINKATDLMKKYFKEKK